MLMMIATLLHEKWRLQGFDKYLNDRIVQSRILNT